MFRKISSSFIKNDSFQSVCCIYEITFLYLYITMTIRSFFFYTYEFLSIFLYTLLGSCLTFLIQIIVCEFDTCTFEHLTQINLWIIGCLLGCVFILLCFYLYLDRQLTSSTTTISTTPFLLSNPSATSYVEC